VKRFVFGIQAADAALYLFMLTTLSGSVSVRIGEIVGCDAEICLRK
jgi:hypothetical protein